MSVTAVLSCLLSYRVGIGLYCRLFCLCIQCVIWIQFCLQLTRVSILTITNVNNNFAPDTNLHKLNERNQHNGISESPRRPVIRLCESPSQTRQAFLLSVVTPRMPFFATQERSWLEVSGYSNLTCNTKKKAPAAVTLFLGRGKVSEGK
jgi:hypothetical protein